MAIPSATRESRETPSILKYPVNATLSQGRRGNARVSCACVNDVQITLMRSPRSVASRLRARTVVSRVVAIACMTTACATTPASYASRAAAAESAAREAVRRESQLNVASIPQNTLSVSPLTVLSTDTSYASLGYGFASLLVNDLSQSPQLALVERLRLEAVLRELDLAKRGRIDTLTAPRVGKLIGARQMVVGSLDLRTRGNVRVQSYVANATTGKVGSSLTGSATLNQIFDAEKSLASSVLSSMTRRTAFRLREKIDTIQRAIRASHRAIGIPLENAMPSPRRGYSSPTARPQSSPTRQFPRT